MPYEVGDILWVMGKERPGLQIYRVVEEVTKRTLDGTATSYRLQTPGPKERSKLVSLENIDGTICKNCNDAREMMQKTAADAIERMIKAAEASITKNWGSSLPLSKKLAQESLPVAENIVELPDGTTAVLKTSLEDL